MCIRDSIIVEKRTFMDTYELVVPCHFGLEAVTKREIYDLGYEIKRVEDGRVTFAGDAEEMCIRDRRMEGNPVN